MKTKPITIALLAVLAGVVGCASVAPVKFVGPNGKTAYSMRCSGMGRSMEECYQRAGEVCPSGYNIIDNSSGTVAMMTQGTMIAGVKRDMAIECK
ncbi:hypothetical protein [Polynucleobacter sp. UB-Raua-W9]|uniref:hypothetical protein n=1 Tax=Polynucleobacter sp. UB-Raua-W9 TaxID=1819736 RepID=UPI001BFDEFC3|nr:hypothetical protein [Polynucleobacter sp. UB-Raua-W9]QWD71584.1 hypothetical protein AOC07_04785 [Polynucleobacter sp. UB-Raua-W9]